MTASKLANNVNNIPSRNILVLFTEIDYSLNVQRDAHTLEMSQARH